MIDLPPFFYTIGSVKKEFQGQIVTVFKIAPHKQKSITSIFFFAGRWAAPLANWALCLSTPKHNGKSGTANMYFYNMQSDWLQLSLTASFRNGR
jgi:hypothetical protein